MSRAVGPTRLGPRDRQRNGCPVGQLDQRPPQRQKRLRLRTPRPLLMASDIGVRFKSFGAIPRLNSKFVR
jgi:hypothetical protein